LQKNKVMKEVFSLLNHSSVKGEKTNILKGLVWPLIYTAILGILIILIGIKIMETIFGLILFIVGLMIIIIGGIIGISLYYHFYISAHA
jgi:hypothetical protein